MEEPIRNITVIHQILSIADIDFESECIYGYTELTIASAQPDLEINTINLNCKQCKLYCVVFNGSVEAQTYEYCDPSLIKPCNDETKRDLQSLLYQDEYGRLSVDADEGNGEMCITVPDNIKEQLKLGQQIKLAVEFCLEKPEGGVRFVIDRGCESSDISKNSYLYTIDNQSSCWFPCIQSYNEFCTWKIEITCDEELDALSSGNLIETEDLLETSFTDNTNGSFQQGASKRKKFHYFLAEPTCAPNIGICVGKFSSVTDANLSEVTYYGELELLGLVKNTTAFLR